MRRSFIFGGVVALVMIGCALVPDKSFLATGLLSEVPVSRGPVQKQLASTIYRLGKADQVDITIYRHPELSQTVVVGTDGLFTYPLIGTVRALGRTVAELEKELTQKLSEADVEGPLVSVTVTEYRNRHVYVLGEVKSPGVYMLPVKASLKALIATANGPTDEAARYVLVVRGERRDMQSGRPAKVRHLESLPGIRVDLNKVLAGEVERSVQIHSGDMVYVPRQFFSFASQEAASPRPEATVLSSIELSLPRAAAVVAPLSDTVSDLGRRTT